MTMFALYFGLSVVLLLVAMSTYTLITPYNELQLVRDGNVAAAISLVGAVIGFALPIASLAIHSVDALDMFKWGAVALTVQLFCWAFVMHVLLRGIKGASTLHPIAQDHRAAGILLAGASITAGILNAACLTY